MRVKHWHVDGSMGEYTDPDNEKVFALDNIKDVIWAVLGDDYGPPVTNIVIRMSDGRERSWY